MVSGEGLLRIAARKLQNVQRNHGAISLGKFQPLRAPLTKRWEVATSNEKESCLKTAEMSCRLVCGVITPNDLDKLYEALVKATEKQGLTTYFH